MKEKRQGVDSDGTLEEERRGIRVEIDVSRDRMNAKIRNAQIQKIPYMLIIGDREMESDTIGIRLRSGEDIGALGFNKVLDHIKTSINSKI